MDRTTKKGLKGNHSRGSSILRNVEGQESAAVQLTQESSDVLQLGPVFLSDTVM